MSTQTTPSHYHDHVDDAVKVGARLKEARLVAGLSQRKLSFRGCSAAYISRLEAGHRVPSVQLATKIAARLNVTLEWLLRGEALPDPWFEAARAGFTIFVSAAGQAYLSQDTDIVSPTFEVALEPVLMMPGHFLLAIYDDDKELVMPCKLEVRIVRARP